MVIHSVLVQVPCRQDPEDMGHLAHVDAQLLAQVLVDACVLLLVCDVVPGSVARPHGCHHPALEVLGIWERLALDGEPQGKVLPKCSVWANCCMEVTNAA